MHDCVCRLLAHADRYDLPRDGRKLLFRAIHNGCVNARLRRRRPIYLDPQGCYDDEGPRQIADVAVSSPPELAMAEELRLAIVEGLQRLTVPYRSALELASLGYRPAEVAEILQMQPERVRVILFCARKAMAGFLNAHFSGPYDP